VRQINKNMLHDPRVNSIGEVIEMNTGLRIPQGDDTVKVELTVKEAMALAGVKFLNNHDIEISARKKLNNIIDDHYIEDNRPVN
jgi:hypothetical protein